MRCRHKARLHHLWGEYEQAWGEAPHIPQSMSEATSCVDCGETLSLGPANDEPEAVRIEIRAAEIAATVYRGPMGSLCFQRMPYAAWCNWIGAGPPDIGVLTPQMTLDYAAGGLARVIATHDGSGGE